MGLLDKVKGEFRRMSHSEEEDDYEEFEPIEPRPLERKERRSLSRENSEVERERSSSGGGAMTRNRYESERSSRNEGERRSLSRGREDDRNIVELHTNTLQQVVIREPREYEEVQNIADFLCRRFTIFLNLERTDPDVATRILDFISGVAYANDGCVRRVAEKTYVVTPFTVNLIDSLMDELENEGIFSKTSYD